MTVCGAHEYQYDYTTVWGACENQYNCTTVCGVCAHGWHLSKFHSEMKCTYICGIRGVKGVGVGVDKPREKKQRSMIWMNLPGPGMGVKLKGKKIRDWACKQIVSIAIHWCMLMMVLTAVWSCAHHPYIPWCIKCWYCSGSVPHTWAGCTPSRTLDFQLTTNFFQKHWSMPRWTFLKKKIVDIWGKCHCLVRIKVAQWVNY